ncbi:MAG: cardiolipin synthase [Acetobacteraceae bacterium]
MSELWIWLLRIRAEVVLPAGFVLALAVTAHVLLRKREVQTSAGWIGLAWFAPFTGAVAYLLFGINRVQRRARHRRDPAQRRPAAAGPDEEASLSPLQRGIGRITGRKLLAVAQVQTYDSDEAYAPMLEAIGAARHSIGLSSYIFRGDQWGGRFIEALIAAQARGVTVRVLIDGIGGGWLYSAAYHRLRRGGVPAAQFFHSLLPWRMPFINLRSHKKILVVDGTIGFTGGLNIADENSLATHPKEPVLDTHFRLEGPVVAQLTEAFLQDWSFATGEELGGSGWFPELAKPSETVPARVIDSGPDEDLEKIEFAILEAVACAESSIVVMTPYFLPDDRLITALAVASMRGVAVTLVIPQKSNHGLVDWACRATIGPLLDHGVAVWQCPPPFRHSKMMVVDAEWCLIGSANWDMRSFRLNFELCIEIYDRSLAAALTALMRRGQGPALTREALEARPLPIRVRDAAARLLLPYL